MPSEMDNLKLRFGDARVQEATRLAFPDGSERQPNHLEALTKIKAHLGALDRVGKPLEPGQPAPGAAPIVGSRVSTQDNPILGNSPTLDDQLQSGWHVVQVNNYDAWFNIVPNLGGGYHIYRPVCRRTGDDGPGTWGKETTGVWTDAGLDFTVEWNNGPRGRYLASLASSGVTRELVGVTYDVSDPNVRIDFYGTPMPLDADLLRPGGPTPGPAPTVPLISVQAVQNQQDQGWNVTIGGSGFQEGEAWQVDGRYVGPGVSNEEDKSQWATYSQGIVDNFLRFGTTFGVTMPLGAKYEFRGIGERSGQTPVVAIG